MLKEKKKNLLKIIGKISALLIFTFLTIFTIQFSFSFIFALIKDNTAFSIIEQGLFGILLYGVSAAIIIFVPKTISKKWGTTREELGLKNLPTFTDIGLVIASLIAFLALSSILTKIFELFPWFNATESQNVGFTNSYTIPDKLIAYFSLCILAPIAEEIIFRGWLYGKLRKTIPDKKLSIALSIFFTSLLFAILHGQWNVGIVVFAMSIIMCITRELTGTIYSGIFLHILKNSIAFALMFIV